MMHTRPASLDDLPAITALLARYDTHWFGAPENDESEVREDLERVRPLETRSLLAVDDDELVGATWWWGTDSAMVVDPAADRAAVDALLDWFEAGDAPALPVLNRDEQLVEALQTRGWRHDHSSFELVRPLSPEWLLDEPVWPDGVDVQDLRPGDAAAVHHLVYTDAQWAAVPGHVVRDFEEWRSIFVTDTAAPEQQVLAWRGDRLVGAALGRFWSDGTGWVAQLAVAVDERGNGLGRALLLEALRRRRAGGARALGLAVDAANEGALQLYLDVGLRIDREWQIFVRAGI